MPQDNTQEQIARIAAALVVDTGADMARAKQKALRQLGLPARTPLPDNRQVDAAIRSHLRLFQADRQPRELHLLRELALHWMQRLAAFDPLIGGAVWQGTATRQSDIHLQLFSDDPKEADIWLLNQNLTFDVQEATGLQGQRVPVLTLTLPCAALQTPILLCLWIHPRTARRGTLLPDAQGEAPHGTADQLRQRIQSPITP